MKKDLHRGIKVIPLLMIILILGSMLFIIEKQSYEYEEARFKFYLEDYLGKIEYLLNGNEVDFESVHRSKLKVVRKLEKMDKSNVVLRAFKKVNLEEKQEEVNALWEDVANKYYLTCSHKEISRENIEHQVSIIKNEWELLLAE